MKSSATFLGILWMVFLPLGPLYGQMGNERKIDSLKEALKLVPSDTTKVNLLTELSLVLSKIDSVETFKTAHEALELSQKIGYGKGEAAAYFSLGGAYMDYFDLQQADHYLDLGLPLIEQLVKRDSSKDNLRLWLRGHYYKAVNHSYKGEVQQEVAMTDRVIPIAQKLGDLDFLTNVYTNMGIMNMNQGQYATAYDNLKKSAALNKRLKSPDRSIFTNLMLSQLLYSMDSVTQMRPYLEEAKNALEADPEALDWHLYHTLKGLYYSGLDQYENAIASLDKAKEIVMEQQMAQEYFILLQRYATVCEEHKDYPEAIRYMTEFIATAKEKKKIRNIFQGYYKRSQYEAAMENYKNAYTDNVKAFNIYDSLENAANEKSIRELALKYDTAEKEKEILSLTITNEKKKSQTYLLLGIVSALALLLFGGYYLYNQRLRKSRKKEYLYEAEMNRLKQEQQSKIFAAIIEGQEKERKRLAIDLHDGLGGRLSGISMNLSKLDKEEPEQYPKKDLQKVMEDLGYALTELRAIARNMMPETLVKFGLQAALKDYCSSMTGTDTKVVLQFYGDDHKLDLNQQVTIYRVIQELINNAVKHARATEVLVQYMQEGNKVDITVEDNGIGFDKDKLETMATGLGLSNLRTRVAYLKGELDFSSEANEGTTVNIHLNLDAA